MYCGGLIESDMKTVGVIVALSDLFEFTTICQREQFHEGNTCAHESYLNAILDRK